MAPLCIMEKDFGQSFISMVKFFKFFKKQMVVVFATFG